MKLTVLTVSMILSMLMAGSMSLAETTTTTTTTTHADGSTTVVEQQTSTETEQSQISTPQLVGPTGATGTIRRSNRRQNRRNGDAHIDR